jgi:hypothetical protein
MSKICQVLLAFASILHLAVDASPSYAADPCVQSPEAYNQGNAPRCAANLCGLDCFQCPQILAAAANCGTPPAECPKEDPDTSCTKIKPVEATLNIGTVNSDNCPSGGKTSWALQSTGGTAYLTVLCDKGSVQTIRNVVFMDSRAKATGSQCGWNYHPSVSVTWSEGKQPTLSIEGFNRPVVVSDFKAASVGPSITFAGAAQAPLTGAPGYHSSAPISMTISGAGKCDCEK